ncbi:phosphatidylserine decarboxylase family protein [Tenuifilum thalassicum]|uniref:Phosphatidylserine decarboxylase proenzyme n=1 Tax=Tenuifilum thalassicum TaxID=2590900 RepID=A0A7D4CFF4_9BACT|nr:phosphatidylserine decarboxylase family protein [Tenuifilum thalassicum]QKG78986.1 phosphatidylserine decarboxylase family protein [Tenuifilum thalassicum]
MKIHKEGYSILFVALTLCVAFCIVAWLILPLLVVSILIVSSLLLLAFLTRFFRVPFRTTNPDSKSIYSPADGTVVAIEEVDENEYFNKKCIQVSVFMSVWNVHINWFPINGIVKYYKYHPGDYLVAWHPKSSTHNERTSVVIERPDGVQIMLRQIAGAVARRIVCYAEEGKEVDQFSELGFIKFGSRVDIFLPLDADVKVSLGQKVKGNQTVIAQV